jgi:N-acetylmuramoyl-L-alanine amidase
MSKNNVLICLDPGHGGKDPGAIGFGLHEADVCLKLAKMVSEELGKYEGVAVTLTRWDDRFISLSERAAYANRNGVDYFISLHNNAASASAHGFESYIYTQPSAASVARQNVLHETVAAYMAKYGIRDRGKKRANYAVLRETKMPAILLENLFITNERENKLLRDDNFLRGLAAAIAAGIAKMFGLKQKAVAQPSVQPQPKPQPKPMHRVLVDGKAVIDSAYHDKVLAAVKAALDKEANKIEIVKR